MTRCVVLDESEGRHPLNYVAPRIAAEPALTLLRSESRRVERTFPDGVRLEHTVIARGTSTELILDSRIKNIGRVPATITVLCYPSTEGSPLRHYYGVGPACCGLQKTLSTPVENGTHLRLKMEHGAGAEP